MMQQALAVQTVTLFDLRNESQLNDFIATVVQPDSAYIEACNSAVETLVNILQHNAPQRVRPCRVIKGGSFCKGTAVLGKSDIDLDVMLAEYTDVEMLVDDMEQILKDIEACFRRHGDITVKKSTHRCVQVTIRNNGCMIEADVLPAVDLLEGENDNATQVFDQMACKTKWMKGFYSPCLAPLQRELFQNVPTKVKSLIRILKYWKKHILQEPEVGRKTKWPASYALELIALDTWRRHFASENFNMSEALKKVLQSLVDHQHFSIAFQPTGRVRAFYDIGDYNITRRPYIMDPCNPYNNVYYKGAFDWERTAQKARKWLSQPLFA